MTERSKRQIEIVEKMIVDAFVSAGEFERDRKRFAESRKIDDMAEIIDELSEWIEERDADRLESFGISMEEGLGGQLLFRIDALDEPFIVRPRADMTIAAGRKILAVDPECPVLEEEVYAEVLERIFIWAGVSENR